MAKKFITGISKKNFFYFFADMKYKELYISFKKSYKILLLLKILTLLFI